MTRVIFMGTPDFAVPSLTALTDAGYELAAVVTQPDRPKGRGRKLEPTPVKARAQQLGLTVLQPASLRNAGAQLALAALKPDVLVVAAFGQILRPAVLEIAPHGSINVHASLLPRWRGAAPVQAAILAGDQVTGSTIIRMDEGMDTGPILAQAALSIEPHDTSGSLTMRLARQGADLLIDTLPRWLAGEIEPQLQDAHLATICRPVRKEQGRINWQAAAVEIARAVRAFDPWPAAHTTWQGSLLKVLEASAIASHDLTGHPAGTVLAQDDLVLVVTGEGLLRLSRVQLAGRKPSEIADFVRGQRDFIGSRLGD